MAWVITVTVAAAAHAPTHKSGGADELKLNEFADPTGAVNINNQQLRRVVLEQLASAPSNVTGRIFYLQGDEHPYIYCP